MDVTQLTKTLAARPVLNVEGLQNQDVLTLASVIYEYCAFIVLYNCAKSVLRFCDNCTKIG
jgi:hypothetical protein